MNAVALAASVLLGVAFVVAGGSKLAAHEQWPEQARGLGAPAWTIPVVPWVELALGASLIVQLGRRPVAISALGMLVVFTALIVHRLRLGERPPCACFGAWSTRPIGAGHLARNGVLMALAVLAAL